VVPREPLLSRLLPNKAVAFYLDFAYVSTMRSVITVPALGDNLMYVYPCGGGEAFVVDASDAAPLINALRRKRLNLHTILVTHHHRDHTAGVAALKKQTGCKVVGGDARIPQIDEVVDDGSLLSIGLARVKVVSTPGHTLTSLCYYLTPSRPNEAGIIFTGDTLFVAGCGRVIEGDASMTLESLRRLGDLPDNTLVYCGHDYTIEDYEFALTVEPGNPHIAQRLEQARQLGQTGDGQGRKCSEAPVASTIGQEKLTNPFLRVDSEEIKASLGMAGAAAVETFAELRRRKDVF